MENVIQQMLSSYEINNIQDRQNAMKEIMQEMVLSGLSRAGFFKEVAFYGGTALRIFYALDRFSEDLDFSLTSPNPEFDLAKYFPTLEKEIAAFGLKVNIERKDKKGDSQINSAFLKANTVEHLLHFYPDQLNFNGINPNELVKIKFEVDTNPPQYASFERRYQLLPFPYEILLYDEPSLFAGKLHALIGRSWQNRVKGRDLYDYIFYLSRGSKFNLPHLQARLIQSGHIEADMECSLDDIKKLIKDKLAEINYKDARDDVMPFVRDIRQLDIWSEDFFRQITDGLKEI